MTWLVVTLVLVGGYVIGWLLTWRTLAWRLSHEFGESPGMDDVVYGVIFGGVAALAWPAVIVITSGLAEQLMREPATTRKKRELDERERRIAQMERELGIR